MKRPPVIAIMGHVDHGKTTLLDHIRKTNVASREAGGITQSIGAYEIEVRHAAEPKSRESEAKREIPRDTRDDFAETRKITFIDTPGHEAFACMRTYGANVADLAILVVAADDGVKPQTKDALQCILDSKTPYLVALTKIDLPGANVEKVKQDLMQIGVFLEGYGGNISWHGVSGKTGQGVSELLDLVLLAAELEDLTYDPSREAQGIVLSCRRDPRRGTIVGVVVKDGTLLRGHYISTTTAHGKIKMLETFLGKAADTITPSAPAIIIGFEHEPMIGEEFTASAKMSEAKSKAVKPRSIPAPAKGFNLILKADERGSLEALQGVVARIGREHPLHALENTVGVVTENDLKQAATTNAIIVAFRSKIDRAAENLASTQKIKIISSDIIYELKEALTKHIEKAVAKDLPALEVLALFGPRKGKEQVVGGRITQGTVRARSRLEIWNKEKQVGEGRIINLQSGRKDVVEVHAGEECGMLVESTEPIAVGERLLFLPETS